MNKNWLAKGKECVEAIWWQHTLGEMNSGDERDASRSVGNGHAGNGTVELRVLHVDDNEDDVVLLQAACRKSGLSICTNAVRTVGEALGYLRNCTAKGRGDGVEWPDVVVLDLALVDGSGVEIVNYIRGQPSLKDVRVVVLSGLPSAAVESWAAGCPADWVREKPVDLDALKDFVGEIYGRFARRGRR